MATSSPFPNLAIGILEVKTAFTLSIMLSVILDCINPGETQFNVNLPFPEPPTEPNKLVGMVLSPTNELITNAIVEILKADGTVARAVKTNALGQFFVTTPLESGQYVLVAEKDGLQFEPKQLELNGAIVKPIEIRSLS